MNKNVLAYWNRADVVTRWPYLHRIALITLAAPCASSFSERIFSITDISSSGRRASLSSKMLEALAIVRFGTRFRKVSEKEKAMLARPVLSTLGKGDESKKEDESDEYDEYADEEM